MAEKWTVLVCDDEEIIRLLICEALKSEGYQCLEAANARELMDVLEDSSPDLILLDLVLPDSSGQKLIPILREKKPNSLVIIVTATCDLNVAIHCIRLGAYDYITKPINIAELLSCVRRAVEKVNLQRQLDDYKHHLEDKVGEQAGEIRRISLGAFSSLSFALEAKDSYTAGHSRRVADIGVAIGERMGLSQKDLEILRWGGLLHDLAKIAVDRDILNKEGGLTPLEYEHIMTHPFIGACIAGSLVNEKRLIEIIQYHHARYDGKGLRQTLRGEEIPLMARIISLADAYDAMTSNRSYRHALSREKALEIISQEAGGQFDPEIVRIFCQMSEKEILPERPVILIADDDESIRLVVKSALGNDYTVIEAKNEREAVLAAAQNMPRLIIINILMSNMKGVQVSQAIKSNPDLEKIPIILIGSPEEMEDQSLAAEGAIAGFIPKPFSIQELLEAVRRVLEK